MSGWSSAATSQTTPSASFSLRPAVQNKLAEQQQQGGGRHPQPRLRSERPNDDHQLHHTTRLDWTTADRRHSRPRRRILRRSESRPAVGPQLARPRGDHSKPRRSASQLCVRQTPSKSWSARLALMRTGALGLWTTGSCLRARARAAKPPFSQSRGRVPTVAPRGWPWPDRRQADRRSRVYRDW